MIKKTYTSHRNVMLLAGLALATMAATAPAAMIVTLTSGATTVIITDNLAGDSNPAVGQITFVGPVGSFSTTITTATSNSPGAAIGSILQTSSIDVRNTSAIQQTLTITVGDINFVTPTGPAMVLGSSYASTFIGATLGDNTSFQSFVDVANVQFAESGPTVTTTGPQVSTMVHAGSPQSFDTPDAFIGFAGSAPYSLTNMATITLSANAQSNISGTTTVTLPGVGNTVPEPATLGILAPAVLGLLVRRRKMKA